MNIMHTEMWREVSIKVVNDCFTFNKTKDWGLYLIFNSFIIETISELSRIWFGCTKIWHIFI